MKNLYNICLGVYTGVNDTEDGEEVFICERERLILELGKPCDCKAVGCMISSIIQVIHLLILLVAYNVSTFPIDRPCCVG